MAKHIVILELIYQLTFSYQRWECRFFAKIYYWKMVKIFIGGKLQYLQKTEGLYGSGNINMNEFDG